MPWVRLLCMVTPALRTVSSDWIQARWKLSRADRAQLVLLRQPAAEVTSVQVKEWLRAMPRSQVVGKVMLAAADEALTDALPDLIVLANTWEIPIFPVNTKSRTSLPNFLPYAIGYFCSVGLKEKNTLKLPMN